MKQWTPNTSHTLERTQTSTSLDSTLVVDVLHAESTIHAFASHNLPRLANGHLTSLKFFTNLLKDFHEFSSKFPTARLSFVVIFKSFTSNPLARVVKKKI